jgi:hypothetical protein
MKIEYVPLEWVNYTWDKVSDFIEATILHSKGDFTLDQVRAKVTNGDWKLMVAVEDNEICGAATVSFFNRPLDRVALVTTIGGRLITNYETFEQLQQFARANGATKLESAARESVARMLKKYGFVEKYRTIEVKL